MSLSFVMWGMHTFNDQNFGICGKTIGSLRRNVVRPLLQMLRARGYKVKDRRSDNLLITERRVISPEGVRRMCIGHEFYTRGDNAEYGAMLDKVGRNSDDMSNEVLCEIAEDIMSHTDPARIDGMDVASMMFLIDNEVCHHCFDVYEGRE